MAFVENTRAPAPALTAEKAGQIMEAVLIRGDLSQLTHEERAKYYVRVCDSLGLNPMTKPFEYLELNKKLVLYARKDATDQLRRNYNVSITELHESERDGIFIVTAHARDGQGRSDAAKGAVSIVGLKAEALANALMKAETKAKRRVTLSLCGLGFLDETEVEDIPAVAKVPPTKTSISQRAIAAASGPSQAFRASEAGNIAPVDELPDHSAPPPDPVTGEVPLSLEDEARAAAHRGEDVFAAFWKRLEEGQRFRIGAIGEELRGLMKQAAAPPKLDHTDHTDRDGVSAFLERAKPADSSPATYADLVAAG